MSPRIFPTYSPRGFQASVQAGGCQVKLSSLPEFKKKKKNRISCLGRAKGLEFSGQSESVREREAEREIPR